MGVVEAGEDLVVDLLSRAEDVRVVLREMANPQEPVERPARLVAMEGRGLCVADGQIPVTADVAPEQKHVPGAVHGLQPERLAPAASIRNMLSRYFSQWPEMLPELGVVEDAASSPPA